MGLPTVMTVMGPVPPDALGVVLPHEHLFCDILREYRADGLLNDPQLMSDELTAFKAAGGGTVVDLTGSTLGRQPQKLRDVSARTQVHVVMGCGGYRDPYLLDAGVDRASVEELADELVREIEVGVGDTGIRPGIIGEIGTNSSWVSALEERMLRAAGRAHLRTGLAISLHAARWPVGRAMLRILEDEGVDPGRVVVGHLDTVPDPDYHLEMAAAGCFVEFDGFSTAAPYDVARNVRMIAAVAAAGHVERLLISHDLFRLSHFSAYGGVGLTFIMDVVLEKLESAGLSSADLEQILEVNPRRALCGI